MARLHRARHACRPCCLVLCFVASLLRASPLAREGMWHGPAASPRPFAMTPCGMPVSASVPYKHISSPLGIRPVALAWLPVASFPLVSGCFLATAVRSVPPGLSQASPSRLTCGQFISICFRPVRLTGYRPVELSLYPPSGSELRRGRLLSASVRPAHLGWRPAVPSRIISGSYIAACFATNEVLYICVGLPSVTLNTEPEHLKLKAHFCHPTSMCYWFCV